MRTYIANIIPRIQQFSRKLDDLTRLTNYHWVSLDDLTHLKKVYIFRDNKKLIISENGIASIGDWDYLGNQSLFIDTNQVTLLVKFEFFDENVIALNLDNTNKYAFFINENKFGKGLNTLNDVILFLTKKYLSSNDIEAEYNYIPIEEYSPKVQIKDFKFEVIFRDNSDNSREVIYIKFMNKTNGIVYFSKHSRKYFYRHPTAGNVFGEKLEDIAYQLFLQTLI